MNEKIMLSVSEKLNENFNRSMELMTQNMMTQVANSLADCFQNAPTPIMQKLESMDKKIDSAP